MAEIDDAELARLQNTSRLMSELLGSPKTKAEVQKALKTHHPDYVTDAEQNQPYIEGAQEAAKKILDDHLKATKSEQLEKDFQNKLKSYRLSKDNPDGYTDEGIDKIVGLMKERTIPDVDAAVALFEKMNPAKPEPPSGYTPTGWNFASREKDDEDRKMLFEDPDAWSDREASKVWAEMKTQTNQ